MIEADVLVRTSTGSRRVSLAAYLEPAAEERAHESGYQWIKGLRNLPVDGADFRSRFTIRDDSLWWFTEIYLHKQQVVLDIHRVLSALDALITREQPRGIEVTSASAVVRHLAPRFCAARGVECRDGISDAIWWGRLARLDMRARGLMLSALLSADRYRGRPAAAPSAVAAFIHRAFWRAGGDDGSAESYIGPVLQELERRAGPAALRYVGIGPATNFRAARRWTPLHGSGTAMVAIERFAPVRALRPCRAMWGARSAHFRILTAAPSLRSAAVIGGIDCWPLVREQLAGVAWLQWPWSVRAMDEAAAALDVLQPGVVMTYAEAGGWGRALILEARRRGIPSAGLQHGFIYRHWLNYRHEPDEMAALGTPPFPVPTRSLVFDTHAANHLRERGHFPEDSVQITGSSRLDDLARNVEQLRVDNADRIRRGLGLLDTDAVILMTTKAREARAALGPFVAAASGVEGAVLVIKPHPAETAEAYADVVRMHPRAKVVRPEASLAELLAIARVVVTVNSTVALDAASFDIPALVIGLPNNLSPFVDAGVFAGGSEPAGLAVVLRRILYDEGFRQQLAERSRAVLGRRSAANGRAAAEAAEAVLSLIHGGHHHLAGSV